MVEAADAPDRRLVRLSKARGFDFGDYQMNYMNYRDWRIIPSSDIYIGDHCYYRSNALGCQGPEIEGGRPVVAVFGDSLVHGVAGDSFVHHVALPGRQMLNAGIEGLILPWIVDRFFELRDRAPLACAAIHSGWHNLIYNERGEAYWSAQFDRIQGVPLVAHFTLFADISPAIIEPGYASVVGTLPGYGLWHGANLETPQGRRDIKAAMDQFNAFIRSYCRERGRVLIDLEPVMAPRSMEELGQRFVDFIHPSPAAYDLMAREIEAQLGPHLPPA